MFKDNITINLYQQAGCGQGPDSGNAFEQIIVGFVSLLRIIFLISLLMIKSSFLKYSICAII